MYRNMQHCTTFSMTWVHITRHNGAAETWPIVRGFTCLFFNYEFLFVDRRFKFRVGRSNTHHAGTPLPFSILALLLNLWPFAVRDSRDSS